MAKLAEANKQTEAWIAEDSSNRWATLYVLDAQYWIDRGIHNLAEFDRQELENGYYEMYKDLYGYRPQDFNQMSTEELQSEVEYLSLRISEKIEEEKKMEELAALDFEVRVDEIQKLVNGCDRRRAFEIIADAEGLLADYEYYGNELLEDHFGLNYGYLKNFITK